METRKLILEDSVLLNEAINNDPYHQGHTADIFYKPNSISTVYEKDNKPIMVMNGTVSLRIAIQFMSNHDVEANKEALRQAFKETVARAKAQGFTEIITLANGPALIRFIKHEFGFKPVQEEKRDVELRLIL